jgi:hypothetical protein
MSLFTIGAITGYIAVCLIAGKLMPVLSLPVILAVAIGGTLFQIIGPMFFKGSK